MNESLPNSKTLLQSEKANAKTRSWSKYAFSERKRRSKTLKRFYRAKRSLAHAKTRLPSEKCENDLIERNRRQMQKRVFRAEMSLSKHIFVVFARLWCFRSIDAFLPLQTLFSLGKSVFDFAIEFRLWEPLFRSGNAFSPFLASLYLGKSVSASPGHVFPR